MLRRLGVLALLTLGLCWLLSLQVVRADVPSPPRRPAAALCLQAPLPKPVQAGRDERPTARPAALPVTLKSLPVLLDGDANGNPLASLPYCKTRFVAFRLEEGAG